MTATCAVVQLYSCTAVQLVPFSTAAAWIGCGAPQWLSVVQLHRASDAEEHFRPANVGFPEPKQSSDAEPRRDGRGCLPAL